MKLGIIYAGQGSQVVGMGKSFYPHPLFDERELPVSLKRRFHPDFRYRHNGSVSIPPLFVRSPDTA